VRFTWTSGWIGLVRVGLLASTSETFPLIVDLNSHSSAGVEMFSFSVRQVKMACVKGERAFSPSSTPLLLPICPCPTLELWKECRPVALPEECDQPFPFRRGWMALHVCGMESLQYHQFYHSKAAFIGLLRGFQRKQL
jgi:hypothetical protein